MKRHKVIFAFVLREFKTRFGTERLGYLWLFLEPIVHIAVLSVAFGFGGKVLGDGIPFPVFIMLGILPWLLFTNIINKGMGAVSSNRALLIYPPVQLIDPFLGRILVEAVITVVIFMLLMVVLPALSHFHVIEFEVHFKSMGLFSMLFLLYVLFSSSVSLILMTLFEMNEAVKKVVGLVLKPLYFLSGIFYTVKVVPQQYQWFFEYNPLSNFMEGFKYLFFNAYDTRFFDVSYLAELTVVFLFLGLFLYKFKLKRNLI